MSDQLTQSPEELAAEKIREILRQFPEDDGANCARESILRSVLTDAEFDPYLAYIIGLRITKRMLWSAYGLRDFDRPMSKEPRFLGGILLRIIDKFTNSSGSGITPADDSATFQSDSVLDVYAKLTSAFVGNIFPSIRGLTLEEFEINRSKLGNGEKIHKFLTTLIRELDQAIADVGLRIETKIVAKATAND